MSDYLVLCGLVFAINLLPAFGPPTWAVLVLLTVSLGLAIVPTVLLGAISAAAGRYCLALGSRRLRPHFSPEHRANIAAAEAALTADRRRAAAGLALFAISPLPSAQLFIAAGLMSVPLVPLTAAFFAGRLVSYTIYVTAAGAAAASFGAIVGDALTSPLGIAIQVVMLAGIVALIRIDWAKLIARHGEVGY